MNTYKKPDLLRMALALTLLLSGCGPAPVLPTAELASPAVSTVTPAPITDTPAAIPSIILTETLPILPTNTVTSSPTPSPTPIPTPRSMPEFSHVIIVLLENREFGSVSGSADMPIFNRWAGQYTLLTQYYAIMHPSLPNYLALIGGDTFNVTTDCTDCFINAPSLPDEIEASGKTWKTYQEDLPKPCFIGSTLTYAQKHNPFIYFDAIRLDQTRCQQRIVPLSQLTADLSGGQFPDFAFITPNICNDGHDCALDKVNTWLDQWVTPLIGLDPRSLIVITWDEGQGDHGCCGLNPDRTGGGRIATLLISDLVKPGFQDSTPYTHYSLLKTISVAWDLPLLGRAKEDQMVLITAPWKQ